VCCRVELREKAIFKQVDKMMDEGRPTIEILLFVLELVQRMSDELDAARLQPHLKL
jgi:hypothetical protein